MGPPRFHPGAAEAQAPRSRFVPVVGLRWNGEYNYFLIEPWRISFLGLQEKVPQTGC